MNESWREYRILIWGKARPVPSERYQETVCAGGVFEHNKQFVRIYPVPLRYLNSEQQFKKYQWIEVETQRNLADNRPESYKIKQESIKCLSEIKINNGDWSKRAEWIITPDKVYNSVEALRAKQNIDNTSIGLVKSLQIINIYSEARKLVFQ